MHHLPAQRRLARNHHTHRRRTPPSLPPPPPLQSLPQRPNLQRTPPHKTPSLYDQCNVQRKLNTRAESIDRQTQQITLHVKTATNEIHQADFVIIGTGAAANSTLAEQASLKTDNGILVDQSNRTSDPAIFAIGDCARQHHPIYNTTLRLESVQNAIDQAKTTAAAITNKTIPTRPLPWFWSDQYDIKLQIAGISTGYTNIIIRGTALKDRTFSAWYFKKNTLIAVDAINDPLAYVIAKKIIGTPTPINPKHISDPNFNLKTLIPST